MQAGSKHFTRVGRKGQRPGWSRLPAKRRGAIIVLAAVLIIVMMAMLALSLDVGYMYAVNGHMRRAVDAGALAGAAAIVEGTAEAEAAVVEYVQRNQVAGRVVPRSDMVIETGHWDLNTRNFVAGSDPPSALRVQAVLRDQPLYFGTLFNYFRFDVGGEAIARHQPRDIIVVLDYSGSMNDDSELRHINSIGRDQVEANLLEIYQELGSPTYGNMQFEPAYISSNDTDTIKTTLGLDTVSYPYPSGSWSDYIYYVRTSSYINNAGYRKRYGYLTLVNYWLEKKPRYSQTPTLWQTSEQPITAVKNAVQVFLAYLQEVDIDDQVGLAVYTHPTGGATLETGLTDDFQLIEDTSRQRQAAHYDNMTNIGAGLREARVELEENARRGAFKMIVLMTDGQPNRPSWNSRGYLLDEAQRCADNGYPVITISLGASADTNLMQQVADITAGVHFNIPGGQSVAAYEEDLKDAFREIADHRPLMLVK